MKLDFETFSDDDILRVLHRAKVVPRKGKLTLQRFPARPDRRDGRQRSVFRVWAGDQPIVHLVVGRSLGNLQRRSQEFYRHNPTISCQPLFFLRHGGIDFFGQEHLGLFNLEEALTARQIDAAGWQQAVKHTAAALAATAQSSNITRLMQELVQFEQQVLGIEALNRLDHVFLRDTIFPIIRLGATSQAPVTAWTNGDFIARNIVRDAQGGARLIDYEFARRTHFPAGDWFRLDRFSHVPETVKLEDLSGITELPPWLEIRCWLEHAVKMSEVSSPIAVQNDLPKISQRLARLVESATSRQYDSVFFSLAPAQELLVPAALAVPDDTMAVEWSRHGSTQKHLSSQIELQPHNWSEVRVDMSAPAGRALSTRLRLPTTPCMVELRSVEIHGRERSDILWTIASAQLGSVVSCTGNILETPTAEGLGLVHFGGESVIAFPPIRLAKSENAVGLAFWVRYVPTVADFTQRLRQAFAEGDVPAILSGGQAIAQIEGIGTAREITVQLFYPDENLYREEKSVRLPLPAINTWTELTFELPPLPAGAILRLDPVDQPGMIEIERLQLELVRPNNSGRGDALRSRSRKGLEVLQCEGDAILMSEANTVRAFSFGQDPVLKLSPLDNDLADQPLRLTLSLRYSPQVPSAIWAQALQDRRNAMIELNILLHEARIRSESDAKELQNTLTEEAQEIQRLAETLTSTQAQAETLRGELLRLQTDISEREQSTQSLSQKLTTSQGEADRLRDQLLQLSSIVAAARLDETELRKQTAELDRHNQQLVSELESERRETVLLRERVVSVEQSREQTVASLAAAQTENENLRAQLAEQEGLANASRQETAERAQHNQQLAAELVSERRETASLQERVIREEQSRMQTGVALAAAQAETENLRAQLAEQEGLTNTSRQESLRLKDQLGASAVREAAMAQSSTESISRSAQLIHDLETALTSSREKAELREHELQARLEQNTANFQAALIREAQIGLALTREKEQHQQTQMALASARIQLVDTEQQMQAEKRASLTKLAQVSEHLKAVLARETETKQQLAQEKRTREETDATLTTTRVQLETSLEADLKYRQLMEQKQELLVESMHALNAGLLDAEHQAAIISRELEKADAENVRLKDLIAKVSQRMLVRLDREASRLLTGNAGEDSRAKS